MTIARFAPALAGRRAIVTDVCAIAAISMVLADISGAQRLQVAVLLIALLAFGLGFFIYDRRHPEIQRRQPPPPPKLDPELPPRPRPYVPAPLRPGGSTATTPPPLLAPEHHPQAPPYAPPVFQGGRPAAAAPAQPASTPDELGLVLPPDAEASG